ncbi:MAG: protein-L-isoaspartate O-methyltransferase [Acidiferrobacterales bacterium]
MPDIDVEITRHKMVEQQIRPWEVLDQQVLDLMHRSPREAYVPEAWRNCAYVDMNIPLGHDQVMMAPKLEARLLQELAIQPKDKILEVGTGSGYMTSLLATLGGRVYSVEVIPELASRAQQNLAAHQIQNITLEIGDAARGWQRHAPYDVILFTGSLPLLPQKLQNDLTPGGRMIAIVGNSPVMEVRLIQRVGDKNWTTTSLFETDLPPLLNAEEPERFVF